MPAVGPSGASRGDAGAKPGAVRAVRPASAAVTYVHLGGILVAGGFAIVTDRASILLLREAEPDYQRELSRMGNVHVWVLGGLTVAAASGLLMLLADTSTPI